MRVAVVQHDIVWEDAAATRAHVTPMIAAAAGDGARLIVLSEMFATGFTMRPEQLGEDEGGPTETFLLDQASQHAAWLVASIAQRGSDGLYRNNCVLAGPDGSVVRYAKIHPFGYGGEAAKYAAGDQHVTVRVDDLRVSLFVCYDLRFADEFWALAPDTDLYVVPANWPSRRHEHWRALLRARAIENQAYVAGVNRVGTEPTLEYLGSSVLLDPMGTVLAEGDAQERVLAAEMNASVVEAVRDRLPFLSDRRPVGKLLSRRSQNGHDLMGP